MDEDFSDTPGSHDTSYPHLCTTGVEIFKIKKLEKMCFKICKINTATDSKVSNYNEIKTPRMHTNQSSVNYKKQTNQTSKPHFEWHTEQVKAIDGLTIRHIP